MNYYVKVWAQGDYTDEKGTITSIREGSFHYHKSIGSSGKFRLGNVSSAYCEFDYFIDGAISLDVGDVFEWGYDTPFDKTFNELGGGDVTATDPNADGNLNVSGMTITDDGDGNLTVSNSIGVTDDGDENLTVPTGGSSTRAIYSGIPFFVISAKTKKNVCHVVGYDAVYLLEKDYSQHLLQIKSSFPMTIRELINDIVTFCGLELAILLNDWADVEVDYFYVDGITARDVFQYIADLSTSNVCATIVYRGSTKVPKAIDFTTGIGDYSAGATGWNGAGTYVICPDNGTYYQPDGVSEATNVWYKENSLDINYQETAYDGIEYVLSNGQTLGYYYDELIPTNIYYVNNNIILDSVIPSSTLVPFNDIAQAAFEGSQFFAGINDIFPYSPISVDIFNFRCPYNADMKTRLVDVDGTYYDLPIMTIDIVDDRVHIESYGSDIEYNFFGDGSSTSDNLGAVTSRLNRLEAAIKTITVTKTTNSNGNTNALGVGGVILSIKRTDASSMVIPYWDTSGNAWNAHVMNSSATPIANTSVTLEIAYYSLT